MGTVNLLFIYGTLLPEFANDMSEWLTRNSKIVCVGSIPGNLYLVSDYPAAIYDVGSTGCVHGLIVALDDTDGCFSVLDSYEGVGETRSKDDEYKRILKPVKGEDNLVRMCWIYLYNQNNKKLEHISSGNYVGYTKL